MQYRTLISAEDLQSWVQKGPSASTALVVVDCRFDLVQPQAGHEAFLAGHVPGARYANLNQDLSGPITPDSGRHPLPQPGAFSRTLARLGIVADDQQVVCYDAANGAFAARLWWMLRAWGHPQVAVLNGGYSAWIAAGGAVASGEETSPKFGALPPAIEEWPIVSTAAVEKLHLDPSRSLIDARAPERYSGSIEPIDSVAGHVPGAVNHPFSLNLGSDGRFLAAGELRRRWTAQLNGRDASGMVAMCGSGVTACHNLLALEVAGMPGAKLYAGSWSEWLRDAQRPVARGD